MIAPASAPRTIGTPKPAAPEVLPVLSELLPLLPLPAPVSAPPLCPEPDPGFVPTVSVADAADVVAVPVMLGDIMLEDIMLEAIMLEDMDIDEPAVAMLRALDAIDEAPAVAEAKAEETASVPAAAGPTGAGEAVEDARRVDRTATKQAVVLIVRESGLCDE